MLFRAGVIKAVRNVVDQIMPKLVGQDPANQAAIDKAMLELDGSANKGNLGEHALRDWKCTCVEFCLSTAFLPITALVCAGANAILGVSLAAAKAGAAAQGIPLYKHFANLAGNDEFVLPVPCMNVINGKGMASM